MLSAQTLLLREYTLEYCSFGWLRADSIDDHTGYHDDETIFLQIHQCLTLVFWILFHRYDWSLVHHEWFLES